MNTFQAGRLDVGFATRIREFWWAFLDDCPTFTFLCECSTVSGWAILLRAYDLYHHHYISFPSSFDVKNHTFIWLPQSLSWSLFDKMFTSSHFIETCLSVFDTPTYSWALLCHAMRISWIVDFLLSRSIVF